MEKTLSALFGSLLLATSVAEGQFNYTTNADGCSITITGYSGAGGAVIIPAVINGRPVTGLGADAFYLCTKVTSITIPGSVRSMGDYAFYECTGLTNVIIANGFTSIGYGAFFRCTGLSSVTIPVSVTNIGSCSFFHCLRLTRLCFRGDAPAAGPSVFSSDTKATVYYLPGTTGWSSIFSGRPTVLNEPGAKL